MAENLGTLNFDVTITDKTESTLKDIKKAIDGLKGGGLDMKLSGTLKEDLAAIKQNILDIQSAAQNITLNTQGLNNIKISSFNVDQATIDALAQRVADTISSKPVTFTKIDTSALTSALTKAIEDSVKMSKGTLMERMKKALTEGASKIRISIDPKSVIDNIEKALNSRNVKISGVTVNKADLAANIREALKGQEFYIKIRIDKQSVNDALNLGNAGNAAGNGMNNAARGAENLHKNIRPLSEQMKTTTQIATILGNSIGNLFSVYAAKNFLESVVNIGGELEKQRMALGAIIGDAEKANTIFKQVSELSMISPFDVQDLITYTKQLSAFGIQYDKLYDTTKRLSDLAAGVGVSFGRIAYEFGQTSARGWLDGRELRMFANSGIPLLQKLSDLYTKLRGEVVTASQVREMVTKREVSFADVEKVIKQMTDAGGEFYQMQEVMAESLAAKWRNLANDWNLMLGKIAESPFGDALKKVAEGLMVVVENWKKVVIVAATFSTALVPFKMFNKLVVSGEIAARNHAKSLNNMQLAALGFRKSMTGLGNVIKNNLIGVSVAAAAAISAYFINAIEEAVEFKRVISGFGQRVDSECSVAVEGFDRLLKRIEDTNGNYKEQKLLIDEMRNKYGEYLGELNEEADLYSQIADNADRARGSIREKVKEQELQSSIQSVYDRYKDDLKTYSEGIGEDLLKFGLKKEFKSELTAKLLGFIKEGADNEKIKKYVSRYYGIELTDSFLRYKRSGDIGGMSDSWFEKYRKAYNDQQKFIDVLISNAGHGTYEEVLAPINEYYKDILENTKNENDNLLIQKERLDAIIAVMSGSNVLLKNGVLVEGIDFGDAKRYEAELKEVELQLAREWANIAREVFGQKFLFTDSFIDRSNTITSSLNPSAEDTDYVKYIEKLAKKRKELIDSIEKRKAVTNEEAKSNKESRHQMELETEEVARLDEYARRLGFSWEDFEKKKKAATPNGKDELLESWKEEARVIKEVYDEYKKMYSLYQDSGKAADKVKENPLFANLDINPSAIYENYSKLIERVKAEMGKDPARNKFEIQLEGQRFQIKFDLDKDSYEKASAEITAGMQQLINKEKDNYDFFKQMYDATGDSQYKGKFQELLASVIYSRLNDEGRGVLIDELVLMDDATLRRYVKDAEAIEAVKIALNEYNAAVKATAKEQQQARLSGVKYMQTYKEEMAALNQKYADLMGISIEEGESTLIELPENASEAVKQLYGEYLRLFSVIKAKTVKGMPWMSNLIEQINKMKAGGGNKAEFAEAFGNAFSQAALDSATILENLAGSDQKMKDIAESIKTLASFASQIASGNYIGAAASVLAQMALSLSESTKAAQERNKRNRNNETFNKVVERLSDAVDKLADNLSTAATLAERQAIYEEQLADLEKQKAMYQSKFSKDSLNYSLAAHGDLWNMLLMYSAWGGYKGEDFDNAMMSLSKLIKDFGKENYKELDNSEFMRLLKENLSSVDFEQIMTAMDNMGLGEYIDDFFKIEEEIKKITDELQLANLGFAFDDFKKSFVETLLDLDSTSQDFWNKFADYAIKASINEYVGENLQSQIQSVYDEFSADFTDDGKVSEQNIQKWRDQVEKAYNDAEKQVEYLNEIWGKTEDEAGLSSSIQGMTEDTAEIIAAYLNTVTANTTIIRSVEESIAYTQLPMLQMTADSQLTQLEMQTDHLLAIRESNAAIAERIQNLDDNFSGTIAGTKQIHMA